MILSNITNSEEAREILDNSLNELEKMIDEETADKTDVKIKVLDFQNKWSSLKPLLSYHEEVEYIARKNEIMDQLNNKAFY